ncbi:MAG: hypothetical protein WCO09_03155 [bacterium]
MPFGKRQITGPNKIKLFGPEEHKTTDGLESRYSWALPAQKHSRPTVTYLNSSTQLFIRIEMKSGTAKEYDCHSPIISLTFVGGGKDCQLRIKFEDPASAVPNHVCKVSSGVGVF